MPYEDLVERLGIQKVFNNDHINENKDFSDNVNDAKFLNFLKFAIKNKYLDDRYSEYTHNLSSSIISQAARIGRCLRYKNGAAHCRAAPP